MHKLLLLFIVLFLHGCSSKLIDKQTGTTESKGIIQSIKTETVRGYKKDSIVIVRVKNNQNHMGLDKSHQADKQILNLLEVGDYVDFIQDHASKKISLHVKKKDGCEFQILGSYNSQHMQKLDKISINKPSCKNYLAHRSLKIVTDAY